MKKQSVGASDWQGKHVLFVEDIIDTGFTMQALLADAKEKVIARVLLLNNPSHVLKTYCYSFCVRVPRE